ncbi:hypothetical protein [Novosphingobium sp. PASSN1]|uniref:hypothetical protein n=1 Tax=Novosphingobium sp. PASSN1 TaxID=2015561 RepID=UPI0026014241|nr:hypothetical protein [Novosphingobium sp. PASSN1]
MARLVLSAALLAPLGACGIPYGTGSRVTLSEAPPSAQSTPSEGIMQALTCMRDSHTLNRIRFGIAVHSDGTGKSSYGYEGATGSFLPQGTAAIWASEAVIRAGGLSMNYYELNTERALRQFGGSSLDTALATQQQTRVPNFIISTAFTALDFIGGPSMDIRAGGIGPYYNVRGASLEVSAEMYRPGDRMTMAISSLNRQVFYRDAGIGGGRLFGKGKGELVTGTIGFTDQQRLQEATRDVIALAVADVLASMPVVPDDCRQMVENLKAAHKARVNEDRPQEKPAHGSRARRDDLPAQSPAPRIPAEQGPASGTIANPDKARRNQR